jgi:hypothetical protein
MWQNAMAWRKEYGADTIEQVRSLCSFCLTILLSNDSVVSQVLGTSFFSVSKVWARRARRRKHSFGGVTYER